MAAELPDLDPTDVDHPATDPTTEDLVNWLRWHEWAYCTYEDCLGLPPRDGGPVSWAVYDAGEDDPPIFTCDFEDDARALVTALTMLRAHFDDPQPDSQPVLLDGQARLHAALAADAPAAPADGDSEAS